MLQSVGQLFKLCSYLFQTHIFNSISKSVKSILYNSLRYKEKRPDNHHRQDLPAKNEDTDQNATTAAVKDIQKTLPQLLQSLKPNFPTILVQSILQLLQLCNWCKLYTSFWKSSTCEKG